MKRTDALTFQSMDELYEHIDEVLNTVIQDSSVMQGMQAFVQNRRVVGMNHLVSVYSSEREELSLTLGTRKHLHQTQGLWFGVRIPGYRTTSSLCTQNIQRVEEVDSMMALMALYDEGGDLNPFKVLGASTFYVKTVLQNYDASASELERFKRNLHCAREVLSAFEDANWAVEEHDYRFYYAGASFQRMQEHKKRVEEVLNVSLEGNTLVEGFWNYTIETSPEHVIALLVPLDPRCAPLVRRNHPNKTVPVYDYTVVEEMERVADSERKIRDLLTLYLRVFVP